MTNFNEQHWLNSTRPVCGSNLRLSLSVVKNNNNENKMFNLMKTISKNCWSKKSHNKNSRMQKNPPSYFISLMIIWKRTNDSKNSAYFCVIQFWWMFSFSSKFRFPIYSHLQSISRNGFTDFEFYFIVIESFNHSTIFLAHASPTCGMYSLFTLMRHQNLSTIKVSFQ